MEARLPKVTFQPGDIEVEASEGDSLLQLAKKNDIKIIYSCDGAPSCAMCRVVVVSGEDGLNSIGRKEEDLIGTSYFITKQRLSCQAKITGEEDVVIDLTENQATKVEKKAMPAPQKKKRDGRPPHSGSGKKSGAKGKGGNRRNRPPRNKNKAKSEQNKE